MDEGNWIDQITTIANIFTPILLLILSGIGWKYRQSMERRLKIEEKLRDDRIEIYNQILEPFVIMLMSDDAWSSNPKNKNKDKFEIAKSKMLSLEYRKVSFKLSLIGSDPVVISFSDLMQYSYHMDKDKSNSLENSAKILNLLGNFLLEIRRSMGNDSTKINNWGMLEWFIKDIKTYQK